MDVCVCVCVGGSGGDGGLAFSLHCAVFSTSENLNVFITRKCLLYLRKKANSLFIY